MRRNITLFALAFGMAVAANAQVITTPPEDGEVRIFERTSQYVDGYNGDFYDRESFGYRSEMVFCENGDVYLKYPVNRYMDKASYIKGTLEGENTITFEFPQLINENNGVQYYVYRLEHNGTTWRYGVDDNQVVNFIKEDDGSWHMDMEDGITPGYPYPSFMWGVYSATYGWEGYGEWNIALYPIEEKYVELPEGIEVQEEGWILETPDRGMIAVKVAIDDENFYLGDFSKYSSGFVKGEIRDDAVIFESGQYLPTSSVFSIYTFKAATINPENGEYKETMSDSNFIGFSYDAEKKRLTTTDQAFVVNLGVVNFYPMETFKNPIIRYADPNAELAEPADPVMLDYRPYRATFFYGWLKFDLPNYDVNGNMLDINRMYYNFYVDGDLYTLTNEEYQAVTDEMVDIPYTLCDYYDFDVRGTVHYLYFKFEGAEVYGIRSIYEKEDGTRLYSNIVEYNTVGVNDLTGENVVDVRYFDLSGKEIKAPQQGLFIKSETLQNGSVRVSKTVIK